MPLLTDIDWLRYQAMKIMNEVESEVSGVILDIQIDNAQPVEYGQTLFLIEPW